MKVIMKQWTLLVQVGILELVKSEILSWSIPKRHLKRFYIEINFLPIGFLDSHCVGFTSSRITET